ncbi:collagenase (plasmid) [Pseudoalteromonas sp. T1lg65]|uniref:collagenase n=1 Tax=Pseudoalteromonas sp. T1lg65 TaxID=2077101 RepID=UPI003F7AE7DF
MKKYVFLSALTLGVVLTACTSTDLESKAVSTMDSQSVLATDWWSFKVTEQDFEQGIQLLKSQSLAAQQDWNEINRVLYGLRGYSYFGELDNLPDEQRQRLSQSVLNLAAKVPQAYSTRFAENHAVAFYRFLHHHSVTKDASSHIQSLLTQYLALGRSASQQADFARWEMLKAFGFSGFFARNNDEMKTVLIENERLVKTMLASIQEAKWQAEHGLWVLGYLHQLLEPSRQQTLDDTVWRVLNKNMSESSSRTAYSSIYLVNSFRGASDCKGDLHNRCISVDIEQVLPIKHHCSDSLFIRATSLNDDQLAVACKRLTAQESEFHLLLATDNNAVANDHNTALRVVIFDNYSDYNRYGQLLFDIQTNNGGMYIEGTPSDPDNQATFYSFRAFWTDDPYKVWNLNHEYVHYLDGRFNKYGGFGHFPDKLVWWSEGLAELVAKGQQNPKAIQVASKLSVKEWPTLETIFATNYQHSTTQIYQWSYLAMRFLAEQDKEGLRSLQRALKSDFYQGYENKLSALAKQHQGDFMEYVAQLVAEENSVNSKAIKKNKVNKLYRYLYRDYLHPKHLELTENHRHLL